MVLLFAALALAHSSGTESETGRAYVDFAVAGADIWQTWLEGDTLWAAKVHGQPEQIATGAEAGDGGQMRPEIGVSNGEVFVMFATSGGLKLAKRGPGGWTTTAASPAGAKGPFLAAMAPRSGGGVVVAGIASNGTASEVFVDGKVVFTGAADGVCMCCKPAVFARSGGLVVAFRDADGPRRDIRTLTSADGVVWTDAGDSTHGRWSPGGCPADGPTLTETTLLVSDARDGKRKVYEVDRYGEHPLPPADPAAEMLQPRGVADASLNLWVEATPGRSNLVVRDGPGAPTVIATTNGRMEPGDPVVVGTEVWIPWQGDSAHLEVWRSVPPPGM